MITSIELQPWGQLAQFEPLLGATGRKVAPTCALLTRCPLANGFSISFAILLFLNDFSPFSDVPVQIGERQAQSQTSGDRESNIQGPRTLAPHF
jgi:hypothetical protein